jgi:NAD(P)H-hydrate epimerase
VALDVKHLPPTSVLTPHPGEAAALLGMAPADVQADRLASVKALAARWQSVVVLKGAASLVAGPQTVSPWVCDLGNPGMGTAGMGDVLAGLCGGLAAQERCDPNFAFSGGEEGWAPLVALAVLAHAAAGDAAARQGGERGLLASDLMVPLRKVVNGAMEGAP